MHTAVIVTTCCIFAGAVAAQTSDEHARRISATTRATRSNGNETIQFVQESAFGLHVLVFDKVLHEAAILKILPSGGTERLLKLPDDRRYMGFGLTSLGSIVVPNMPPGDRAIIDQYDSWGSLIRTIPANATSPAVGYAVSGDTLVRLMPDCALDILDLNSLAWRVFKTLGNTCIQARVAPFGYDRVSITDPTTARITLVNIKTHRQSVVQLSSPEVAAALSYVDQHPVLSSSDENPLKLFALTAWSVTPSGIYALLGPIRRGKPNVVVEAAEDGAIKRLLNVEIPESAERPVLPHWISKEGEAIRMIYRSGHVDSYDAR